MFKKIEEDGYCVKLIKDSKNFVGDRLTTFELTYPRMVHAELMTHRLFSRNAASSRAIPTSKLIKRIEDQPVMPRWWGKNQSGMQAREELTGKELERAKAEWLDGRTSAIALAKRLHASGLHKQIANRVLEPWMFITVIVSATEYENWFHLRDDPNAQPEIAWVARAMRKIYDRSEPAQLIVGDWHLPYIELKDTHSPLYVDTSGANSIPWGWLCKISTARCARVSYLTHDGKRDYEKDVELHDKLTKNGHWSPFEHVAESGAESKRYGNFVGFRQYRKVFKNEHAGRNIEGL